MKGIITTVILCFSILLTACNETRQDGDQWMKPIATKDRAFQYQYYSGQEQVAIDSAAKRCAEKGWGNKAKPGEAYCNAVPTLQAPSTCITQAICYSCQAWMHCEDGG